jgi:hypothetical protein
LWVILSPEGRGLTRKVIKKQAAETALPLVTVVTTAIWFVAIWGVAAGRGGLTGSDRLELDIRSRSFD